ncbi:MAG: hypothetical protein V2A72_08430 [Candidatus Omnitrophota bacterium]
MDYVCPVCNERLARELPAIISHTEKHIVDLIKKDHPAWEEKDGTCRKCYEHYKKSLHPD